MPPFCEKHQKYFERILGTQHHECPGCFKERVKKASAEQQRRLQDIEVVAAIKTLKGKGVSLQQIESVYEEA